MNRSKLAVFISCSGWLLLAAYLYYEFSAYGTLLSRHLFPDAPPVLLFFRAAIFLAPLLFTVMGFLVQQRTNLLRQVRESEEEYRDLYENAPDGYHSADATGNIIAVNDTWLKLLGYRRGEVEGRLNLRDLISQEELPVFEKTYKTFRGKGFVRNFEINYRRKDGSQIPVVINASAVVDEKGAFIRSRAIVRDNSQKRDYEGRLLKAAEEWRATFDSMPYGVMLIDIEFNILRANKYISEISGIPLQDLSMMKCYQAMHGQDGPVSGCIVARSRELGEHVELEWYEKSVGKYFSVSSTPLFDEHKAIVAYIHVLVDITEAKEKERKLGQSKTAFFNMLKDLNSSYARLSQLYHSFILAFANAIDAKSPWTKGHSERVARYSLAIAQKLGLQDKDIEILKTAALLHDIGKIGTDDGILDKPGSLTEEEIAHMKMHPAKGEEILSPVKRIAEDPAEGSSLEDAPAYIEDGQILRILPVIRSHHERPDGRGYPDGLKGDDIPVLAKILCVADSFDSMTADRPYRKAPGIEYAKSELRKYSGIQFDHEVAKAFLEILESDDSLIGGNGARDLQSQADGRAEKCHPDQKGATPNPS